MRGCEEPPPGRGRHPKLRWGAGAWACTPPDLQPHRVGGRVCSAHSPQLWPEGPEGRGAPGRPPGATGQPDPSPPRPVPGPRPLLPAAPSPPPQPGHAWALTSCPTGGRGRGRSQGGGSHAEPGHVGARSGPTAPRSRHRHRHNVAPRSPPTARLPWPPRLPASSGLMPPAGACCPWHRPHSREGAAVPGLPDLSTGRQRARGAWASSTALASTEPLPRGARTGRQGQGRMGQGLGVSPPVLPRPGR